MPNPHDMLARPARAITAEQDAWRDFYREGFDPTRSVPTPTVVIESPGEIGLTRKFLLPVPGTQRNTAALETESVIIPMRVRTSDAITNTLCVSSQVGCAMGCDFCETAQMGLVRSLTTAEITQQWWAATHHLGEPIKNVVFMGMGEPLDNLPAVLSAIRVLTDHFGPAVAMKHITISTVGRTDALAELRCIVRTNGWKKLNLAVSINAPNDEIRSRIMPINRAMPLGELIPMLESWPLPPSKHIMAEYVLIPGVNDADTHADELCERLANVRCCLNVIPYNPRRESPWPAPHETDVLRFVDRVRTRGVFVKRRHTKGRDTMAACGQLGNEHIRRRRFVELTSA